MSLVGAAVVMMVGLVAGLLSGLIGVGGGVLIVPFLYLFYAQPEWFGIAVPSPLVAAVAHATSLFVIVPTAIQGTLAYHRAALVVWPAVWTIAPASVVGALIGAQVAPRLPAEALKLTFGLVLLASAARLVKPRRKPDMDGAREQGRRLDARVTVPIGLAVGLFSALLGVGGGIVAIPLLLYIVRIDLREVAATSMGIIAVTAFAGTVGYMLGGGGTIPGMPWGSIGYVHVVTGVIMFAVSILSVRWGAALNQKVPARRLALMFGAVFALIGVDLVARNAGAALGLW